MVVNYNLLPDANGNGIGQIVVVNTASVVGNDVVSDPRPEAAIADIFVNAFGEQSQIQTAQAGVQGAPGSILEMDVTGFNLYSVVGNFARFRSSVDGREFDMPGLITQHPTDTNRQIFSTPEYSAAGSRCGDHDAV